MLKMNKDRLRPAASAGIVACGSRIMPLVRISLMKGKPAGFGEQVGRIVYETMVETINVPQGDRFQVVTEHEASGLLYDPSYLGIQRSDGIVIIQMTITEGRTLEK